jgi:hypothetical protein
MAIHSLMHKKIDRIPNPNTQLALKRIADQALMLRNMCGIASDFQIVVARFSGLFVRLPPTIAHCASQKQEKALTLIATGRVQVLKMLNKRDRIATLSKEDASWA